MSDYKKKYLKYKLKYLLMKGGNNIDNNLDFQDLKNSSYEIIKHYKLIEDILLEECKLIEDDLSKQNNRGFFDKILNDKKVDKFLNENEDKMLYIYNKYKDNIKSQKFIEQLKTGKNIDFSMFDDILNDIDELFSKNNINQDGGGTACSCEEEEVDNACNCEEDEGIDVIDEEEENATPSSSSSHHTHHHHKHGEKSPELFAEDSNLVTAPAEKKAEKAATPAEKKAENNGMKTFRKNHPYFINRALGRFRNEEDPRNNSTNATVATPSLEEAASIAEEEEAALIAAEEEAASIAAEEGATMLADEEELHNLGTNATVAAPPLEATRLPDEEEDVEWMKDVIGKLIRGDDINNPEEIIQKINKTIVTILKKNNYELLWDSDKKMPYFRNITTKAETDKLPSEIQNEIHPKVRFLIKTMIHNMSFKIAQHTESVDMPTQEQQQQEQQQQSLRQRITSKLIESLKSVFRPLFDDKMVIFSLIIMAFAGMYIRFTGWGPGYEWVPYHCTGGEYMDPQGVFLASQTQCQIDLDVAQHQLRYFKDVNTDLKERRIQTEHNNLIWQASTCVLAFIVGKYGGKHKNSTQSNDDY